ncbi:hypothetical protein [Allomesorhizobium alhagi]|uniref:Transmembrane protein n=1 Tax=Mesorhizobium alhagi CCNWXJ12-2 TaxID=1107882 RepID=H0HY01_9HYPH|nr:hypothetical protein [Mesorhizobium alhagi]EHK54367.1 hypothetical protein MAXJ12_25398 [Mesorhizobium alhagi CCNWXJ12-2]
MQQISDDFLLTMAEVSAGLIGLFIVGMLFYIETGFRRLGPVDKVVRPYFRSSTRIILVLFAIPVGLSFSLVALEPVWSGILFIVLSFILVAANVDTALRMAAVARATRSTMMLVNEVVGTAGVVALVIVPWVIGGFSPTREAFTWAILLAFATGFLSICALVLSAFDVIRSDTAGGGLEG